MPNSLENQSIVINGRWLVSLFVIISTSLFAYGVWTSSIQSSINLLEKKADKQEVINERNDKRNNDIQKYVMQSISEIEKANISSSKDLENHTKDLDEIKILLNKLLNK